MHVLLEFPLNWHTLRFVTGRLRGVKESKPQGLKPSSSPA
jgi:hypothetical protein